MWHDRGNQTLGVSPAGPKLYCYRDVWDVTPMTNMGVLDSSVTVAVDRNVCIHGVVIASQIPRSVPAFIHRLGLCRCHEYLFQVHRR